MVISKSRKIDSESLKKIQENEKMRNEARRKGLKKGVSISTDKPKLKADKPDRPTRKIKKKRVSIR